MSKSEQISHMTNIMARFVGYTGKVLPDDVTAKLEDLQKKETSQLANVIFTTMFDNQRLAKELDRPSCQDTGVIQFLVECGTNFPLIGELEALLREAVIKATVDSPLRHNSVETFDEYNTGKNVGKGTPTVFWESGIQACQQTLCSGFFITCSAVNLTSKEQPLNKFAFQRRFQIARIEEVILNGITRTHNFRVFHSLHGTDNLHLYIER